MRSNFDTIKDNLFKKYPNIKPELIEELIKIYFQEGKEAIKNFDKPEIAFLWGTLSLSNKKARQEIIFLNTLLGNKDNPEINRLTEKDILQKQDKVKRLEECYKTSLELKEGKIERGREGKKSFLKRKIEKYKNDKTKSDNTI